jgi:hypothetical protein
LAAPEARRTTATHIASVDDYQGWGCLLGRKGSEWAVLSWSYGSCNYCDAYEDLSDEELEVAFQDLVEAGLNEEDARQRFENAKGW